MTVFHYEAVSAAGDAVVGEMEADSQAAVIAHLRSQGHVPIRADTVGRSLLTRVLTFELKRKGGLGSKDLALLTQQLATLLHAGLPLDRALEIAEKVVTRKEDRERLRRILDAVRGGRSFADALAAQGGVFPKFYVGMVRAGEAGGSLDATLHHLGEFLEKADAAREQVRSALIYPAVVLFTGCGSVAILFSFVVPRFRPLFEQAGSTLPFTAEAVMAISDAFQNYGWLLPLMVFAGIPIVLREARSPTRRRHWERRLLKLPLIGDVLSKVEIARIARTLGTLLKNGVAPLAALTITREATGNAVIGDALAAVGDRMKEGKGLSTPLAQTGLVPSLAVQLIRVGEETARLDDMLMKVAEIYEQESRRSIERMLSMLVPAMTIGLGVLVAFVIGSILTAVLSVYELAT
jgi:general secretion pathway protein F